MENTFKEYKDWCPDEIDPNIEQAYNKAAEKLQHLLHYEDALVNIFNPCFTLHLICSHKKFFDSYLFCGSLIFILYKLK